MKKFISTLTSLCMSVSLTAGALASFSTSAVDGNKTLKLLADGQSTYTISAADIANGDVTITVGVYLEENEADTGCITAAWRVGDCADSSAIKLSNQVDVFSQQVDEYEYTFSGGTNDGKTITTTNRLVFAGSVSKKGSYTVAGSITPTAMNLTDTSGYFVYTSPTGCPWLGATSDEFPVHEFDVTISQNATPGEYHVDFVNENSGTGAKQSRTQLGYIDVTIPDPLDNLYYGGLGTEGITIVVEGDSDTTTASTTSTTTTTTTTTSKTTTTTTTTASGTGDGNTTTFPDGLVWKVADVQTTMEDLIADEGYIYLSVYVAQVDADSSVAGAAFTVKYDDTLFTWDGTEADTKNVAYNGVVDVVNPTLPNVNFASIVDRGDGKMTGYTCTEEGAQIIEICLVADLDTITEGVYPVEIYFDKTNNDRAVADNENNDASISFVAGSITIGDVTATTASSISTTTTTTTTTTTKSTSGSTTTTTIATSTTGEVLYGDSNVDGKVNIADVVILNKYLADNTKYPLTAQGAINAEVNLDGKLTASDSTSIIKSLVKLVSLPDTSSAE